MTMAAADILIETIADCGVEVVVGLPGDAHFAKSLARAEPNREKIALTILGDRVRELV